MDLDDEEMLATLKSAPPQLETFTLKYISATHGEVRAYSNNM